MTASPANPRVTVDDSMAVTAIVIGGPWSVDTHYALTHPLVYAPKGMPRTEVLAALRAALAVPPEETTARLREAVERYETASAVERAYGDWLRYDIVDAACRHVAALAAAGAGESDA